MRLANLVPASRRLIYGYPIFKWWQRLDRDSRVMIPVVDTKRHTYAIGEKHLLIMLSNSFVHYSLYDLCIKHMSIKCTCEEPVKFYSSLVSPGCPLLCLVHQPEATRLQESSSDGGEISPNESWFAAGVFVFVTCSCQQNTVATKWWLSRSDTKIKGVSGPLAWVLLVSSSYHLATPLPPCGHSEQC